MTGTSMVILHFRSTRTSSSLFHALSVAAAHSQETDAVDFFDENDIPQLSLTRVTPSQIRHMFDHYRHPEWPTSFD
jgi:hypothetical protein